MADYHALGIAIIIFYVPAVLFAFFLLTQLSRPRMAWVTLSLFSCARLASGAVLIPWSIDPSNKGVAAAAEILINVGVIPLLLSTIGQIRIIYKVGFEDSEVFRKTIAITRAVILVGIGLIVAGAVLASIGQDPGLIRTGSGLLKAGYLVLMFVLVAVAALEIVLFQFIRKSSSTVLVCFAAVAIALPFQIVRIIYAVLGAFGSDVFIPLQGAIGALVGMCLVMEYIVVVIYGLTGWLIRSDRSVKRVNILQGNL